jgi:hypothetical protein
LLNLKYDWSFTTDWFVSPQLGFTLNPRESAGGSTKTTLWHVAFPVGMNFGFSLGSQWDWFAGPGIIQYTTKGSGGTAVMSNGTGTATFALPGETSTVQMVTLDAGGSYSLGASRFGLDLIFEGLASNKRSESFMLSYGYRFGGGLF